MNELEIQRLIVRLMGDNESLKKSLTQAEADVKQGARKIESVSARLEARFREMTAKFSQTLGVFGRSMMRAGAVMSATVTAPLALLGHQSARAASDLRESINAVNVVFGDASSIVQEFAKTADVEMGLSRRAFNEVATSTGSLLQNLAGFDSSKAATEMQRLAQRASDMASVFNTDVSDALRAIESALRGETEPIRRFGVSLSAAEIEAKALELGLAKTKKELTRQTKTQAALAIVYQQTNRVANDFANTSHEVANQARIQQARFENLRAEIGEKLLPIQTRLLGLAARAIDLFTKLPERVQDLVIKFAAVAAAVGPFLLVGGTLVTVLSGVVAALPAAIALLTSVGGVMTGLVATVGVLTISLGGMWDSIRRNSLSAWQSAVSHAKTFFTNAVGFVRNFSTNVKLLFDFVRANWANALGDMIGLWITYHKNLVNNALVATRIVIRVWAVWQGFMVKVFEDLFSRDFVVAVAKGVIKAGAKFADFAKFAAASFKAAFTGETVSFEGFVKQIEKDLVSGAEDFNPFDKMLEVVKEESKKFKKPFEGFVSSITELPEFVFGSPEFGFEKGADDAAKSVDTVTDAITGTKKAVQALKFEFQGVAGGTFEDIIEIEKQIAMIRGMKPEGKPLGPETPPGFEGAGGDGGLVKPFDLSIPGGIRGVYGTPKVSVPPITGITVPPGIGGEGTMLMKPVETAVLKVGVDERDDAKRTHNLLSDIKANTEETIVVKTGSLLS